MDFFYYLCSMLVDTISLQLYGHTENWVGHGKMFLHEQFWMLHEFDIRGREFLFSTQPYLLRELRVVWVRRGWANYNFNLVDYHFVEGDVVVFYSDTLVEKKEVSEDFEFDAFRYDGLVRQLSEVGITDTETHPTFVRLHLDEKSLPVVSKHFELVWEMTRLRKFPKENIYMLIRSLLLYVGQLYDSRMKGPKGTRQEVMMNRFIDLVSRYAGSERKIPFYAGKLNLDAHYLSSFVKKQSGRTVMQWVNESALKEVKVWLAYSTETVTKIAKRMKFADTPALSKFFRRETGMAPLEYRRSRRGSE